MSMLDARGGGFLFDVIPQYFPERCYTDLENILWLLFYENKRQNTKKP